MANNFKWQYLDLEDNNCDNIDNSDYCDDSMNQRYEYEPRFETPKLESWTNYYQDIGNEIEY